MLNKNLKDKLVKNSLWAISVSVINKIGALVLTILLARYLLPEKYGIYSIVLSIAMIFYTFSDLGVNSTLLRYISHSETREKNKLYAYYNYIFKIKITLTAITASILFITAYPLSFYIFRNEDLFVPLLISAAYITFFTLESFYTTIYYAFNKVKYVIIKETASQIIKITLALLVFYLISSTYYLVGIFSSFALASAITLAFLIYYSHKIGSKMYKKPKENVSIDKKRIKKFIKYLTIASISTVFFAFADSIIMGFFLNPEYVGYYRAAFAFVIGVSTLILSPSALFLAYFTKIKEKEELNAFLNKLLKYFSIISVPITFGLLLVGKYFIRLFYGYSFLPSSSILYILSIIILPSIFVNIFILLFSAREKTNIPAKLMIKTTIVNIVLMIILINALLIISPLWATRGAAIAIAISFLYYFIISWAEIKKNFNMKLDFFLSKPLLSAVFMYFSTLLIFSNVGDMNLFYGILEVLTGVIIYFLVLFLFKGITKHDLFFISILFKKKSITKNNFVSNVN